MDKKYFLIIFSAFVIAFCFYHWNSAYANDEANQQQALLKSTFVQNHFNNHAFPIEKPAFNHNTSDSTNCPSSRKKKVYFTIRLGQGGFRDDRSPIGKLGGGQLTLDIKPSKYPIAFSISNEYYTNSPDPTHSYEIAGLIAVNLLYMNKLFKSERTNFFIGGGIGRLEVPKGENEPDEMEKGIVYNMEAGVNVRVFWKIGLYGIGKYLYGMKEVNNKKVINFSERIVLLGITFNFGL
jgi:hypothetical protein